LSKDSILYIIVLLLNRINRKLIKYFLILSLKRENNNTNIMWLTPGNLSLHCTQNFQYNEKSYFENPLQNVTINFLHFQHRFSESSSILYCYIHCTLHGSFISFYYTDFHLDRLKNNPVNIPKLINWLRIFSSLIVGISCEKSN